MPKRMRQHDSVDSEILRKIKENLATPFRPAEKYGIASTAFAAIMATESDGVTKNLIKQDVL